MSALRVRGEYARRAASAWITLGGVSLYGLVLAYALVHKGILVALAFALLPAVVWVLSKTYGGLLVGLALLMLVPYTKTLGAAQLSDIRLASVCAAATLLVTRRVRPKPMDAAVLVFVAAATLSWLLTYPEAGVGRILTTELTPVGFYIGARSIPEDRLGLLSRIVLYAGTAGALTVLYEYSRGALVFTDPTKYYWNPSTSTVFRPGGIWGSPPAASTVLCVVVLLGFACYRETRGRERLLSACCLVICTTALVLTFTRAAYIGLGAGTLLFLWLLRSPMLRAGRVVIMCLLVGIAFLLAAPALQRNVTIQEGVLRAGTLSAREGYWQLAFPVITANAHNFLVGIGYGSLEAPQINAKAPVASSITATPQLVDLSLHNEYVSTMVEQGIAGLGALLLVLATAFVPAARRARRTGCSLAAAAAASVFAFAIVMVADVTLWNGPSFAMLMLAVGLSTRLPTRRVATELEPT